jgi:hypothetical protein
MSKSKDSIKSDIIVQLHNQSISLLVDSLAEAQVKIEELTARIAELEKKQD